MYDTYLNLLWVEKKRSKRIRDGRVVVNLVSGYTVVEESWRNRWVWCYKLKENRWNRNEIEVCLLNMYYLYQYVHYSSSKFVAFLYEIVHLKKNLLIADVIIQGASLKNYINIYLVMDKLDSFSACCNILIAFKKIVFSSFWHATSTHISFWKMIFEKISIQRAAA